MISEKQVMDLFEKAQKTNSQKDYDKSDISIIEYFIQELKNILENFGKKGHQKHIKDLQFFYLNFEKDPDPSGDGPGNYLESDILDLFLRVSEHLNIRNAEILLKEAEELFKKYQNK